MAKKQANGGNTGAAPAVRNGNAKKRAGDDSEHAAKRPRIEERTDFSRWRMRDDESRHTWHYLEDDEAAKEWPQTVADKYFLGLPLVSILFAELLVLDVSAELTVF